MKESAYAAPRAAVGKLLAELCDRLREFQRRFSTVVRENWLLVFCLSWLVIPRVPVTAKNTGRPLFIQPFWLIDRQVSETVTRPSSPPAIEEARACIRRYGVYFGYMKTLKLALGIATASLVGIGIVAADPLAEAVSGQKTAGKLVFVTGSNIPQRVAVKAIGTDTTSPVRVYPRAELDRTGRFTTQGVLALDPSVNITGH
jgi:hypothetical protein